MRREHVVASFLVGAVVVVLGFASGLGVNTADQPAGEQPVDAAPDHVSPPAGEESPPPVSGGSDPGSGGRQPVAGGPRPVTVRGTRVPDPGNGGSTPPSEPAPPAPTPPPAEPSPTTPPECEPGALPTWLATAADTLVSVPVVGGLLGTPVAPVLTAPLGGTALTSLEPVGSLLGTCQPATEEQLAAVASAVESGLIPASLVPTSLVPLSEPAGP